MLKVDEGSTAFRNLKGFGMKLDKLLETLFSKYVSIRFKKPRTNNAVDFINRKTGRYQNLFDSLAVLLLQRQKIGSQDGIEYGTIGTVDIKAVLKEWYKSWRWVMSVHKRGLYFFPEDLTNGMEELRKEMVAHQSLTGIGEN